MRKNLIGNYILTAMAVLAIPFGVSAAPINPARAKEIARQQFNASSSATRALPADDLQLCLTVNAQGAPAMYILNKAGGNGFVIVSGDDRLPEVLGFSEEGSFNPDNIPANVQWWLDSYTKQIEAFYASPALQERQQPVSVALKAVMKPIAPMVTTKWNQDAPYNNLCPRDGNALSVTGCVATAMAQVMNFHKWPERPHGSSGGVDFDGTTYMWKNMLDEYINGKYTQTEANAVATLMRQCGASVNMQYSSWASGAYSVDVQYALTEYFDYNMALTMEFRDLYTFSDWNALVYSELAARRPLYYSGSATEGGHAFVCDGYRGNGLFHFNWGWGGAYDGYFILSALNPSGGGIGSYEGGYNSQQMILAGVEPAPKSSAPQERSIAMVCTGGFSYVGGTFRVVDGKFYGASDNKFYNPFRYDLDVIRGVKITNADKPEEVIYVADRMGVQSYKQWAGFGAIQVTMPTDLADGKYIITPAIKEEKGDWVDLRVVASKQTHVELNVENGTQTFVNPDTSKKAAKLILCGMEYAPETQGSGPVVARFFIANVGDSDYFGDIKMKLVLESNNGYIAESTLVTSIPMQSVSTVTFQQVVGLKSDCTFYLYDDKGQSLGSYPVYLTPLGRDERDDRVNYTTLNIGAIAPNFADNGSPFEAGFWISNPLSGTSLETGLKLQLCKYGSKEVVDEISLPSFTFEKGEYYTMVTPTQDWTVDPGYYYWLLRRDNGDYLAGPWAVMLTSAAITNDGVSYYEYDTNNKLAYVGDSEELGKTAVVAPSCNGYTVDRIHPGAFTFASVLENITLPATIDNYGPAAFYCANNLKTLTIQRDVPPAIDATTFSSDGYKNIALVVPTPNVYKRTSLWEQFVMPTWSFTFDDGISYDSGLEMDGSTYYTPYYVSQGQQLSFKVKSPDNKPVAAICTINGKESAVWCGDGNVRLPALTSGNCSVRFTTSIPDGVEVVASVDSYNVFTMTGVQVLRSASREQLENLPAGIYIVNGKKMIFR